MPVRFYLLTAVVGLAAFWLLEEILNVWMAGILAVWISCAPGLWGLLRSESEPTGDQENLSEPGE
jgi:site-specific recombinase